MSLCYKINPALNMILYVGTGHASPSDFFTLEKAVFLEHPRPPGMITLVDALDLCTYFELKDIHYFIDNLREMTNSGMQPGPYGIITKDWGLHLMGDAAKLMAGSFDLKAGMYISMQEAIVELGLLDHKQEILQLWEECRLEASEAGATQPG